VWGSTVLYPSDANQTAQLVEQMAHHHGITFLRTTREKTPILYEPTEKFHIGGCRVVHESPDDKVTVIGAGITLHEALKAHDQLKGQGVSIRVIDLYTVKPIDAATVSAAVKATAGRVVTVEDHWAEGGIGDAVLEALSAHKVTATGMVRLAVRDMPGSGKPQELIDAAGIGATAIVSAVKGLASA